MFDVPCFFKQISRYLVNNLTIVQSVFILWVHKTANNISPHFLVYLTPHVASAVQYNEYIFGTVDTDGLVLLH